MHSTTADNPRMLAIETSGSVCSIALCIAERLVAEYTVEEPNVHDRLLAVSVERLLADTGTSPDNIDAVAVSAGPGSFTGLRIGLAFAKGLCFGSSTRLVLVPTLEACAFAAVPIAAHLHECDIAAIARSRDTVYFVQHFSCEGDPLTEPMLLDRSDIAPRISPRTIVCGPGALDFHGGIRIPGLLRLSARFVARRGLQMLRNGIVADPATAAPLYIEEFVPKAPVRHIAT
ncbi:MAG: tRNA (adenosine(37)-N6)-threonylcarbamoyltransferase complex dimerization subunit type 1 TsaB [Chlorobi bacterium]|jgi:tRNA threonylcarbamoyladenosine biosynthesis protein TsaB|nr:tRNA (adenosine(37)-N6)-threonylcarbamoyltransferase complex dimerization subunit type 1 TsaB [Chlorobiota bacterium]